LAPSTRKVVGAPPPHYPKKAMKSWALLVLLGVLSSLRITTGLELAKAGNAPIQLTGGDVNLPEDEEKDKKPFDPYDKSNYKKETHIAGSVTVECLFACLFVCIIGSVPVLLFVLIGGQELTKTHIGESVALVVWLLSALIMFTNVLTFNSGSGHWVGARSLTIGEAVYVLSQILTTVGYGDMTPATAFSQVWVAVNVILALCLYGSLISEAFGLATEAINDTLFSDDDEEEERLRQEALSCQEPVKNWEEDLALPTVDYEPMNKSLAAFGLMVFIGVMFWHYFPGENKTWLQAIYFSVITLSTVGFGAITAVTAGGFVFGAFWMLFGVATLAAVLTSFVEIMVAFKKHQRMNPDQEKLAFFRCVSHCSKRIDAFNDNGFEKADFLKFGALVSKLATEEEFATLEARFKALAGENGKVTRESIIENEAPQNYEAKK
jgi:voltage-gated potassium channel